MTLLCNIEWRYEDGDFVPDECRSDCNTSGIVDDHDIDAGSSEDCNSNGIPDDCDIRAGTVTVNTTGDIVMNGANSQAQFTQSVNGGGGDMDDEIPKKYIVWSITAFLLFTVAGMAGCPDRSDGGLP